MSKRAKEYLEDPLDREKLYKLATADILKAQRGVYSDFIFSFRGKAYKYYGHGTNASYLDFHLNESKHWGDFLIVPVVLIPKEDRIYYAIYKEELVM